VFQILRAIEDRHFNLHLLVLVAIVFIALPLLKRMLFRRARDGSIYQPPRKHQWTPAQVREAKRLLQQQRRKPSGDDADIG
jgi:hypothetical protein